MSYFQNLMLSTGVFSNKIQHGYILLYKFEYLKSVIDQCTLYQQGNFVFNRILVHLTSIGGKIHVADSVLYNKL